jgi:DNA-binding beta-propeller fold protein YncE
MHRRSFLLALVLGCSAVGTCLDTVAQTPVASPEPTPALAEFVTEITLGSDDSSAVGGVAVDADGTLYVIDSLQDRIEVFDRDGQPVATWGESGNGPGQFMFHVAGGGFWGDLAIGPDGNLYVLDPFNSRVQVLTPDGTFLREWGELGLEEGQFAAPSGIAVDGAGRVYVTEFGNPQLQVFANDGRFLAAWEIPAMERALLRELADVAISATGDVWVTDSVNARVIRLDAEGAVIDTFGERGGKPGQMFSPWGVAVDAAGNLYVAEYGGSRVQVFAPDGTPLGTIGSIAESPNWLVNPIYLTISPDGLLYVADELQRQIQIYRLLLPLASGAGTPVAN